MNIFRAPSKFISADTLLEPLGLSSTVEAGMFKKSLPCLLTAATKALSPVARGGRILKRKAPADVTDSRSGLVGCRLTSSRLNLPGARDVKSGNNLGFSRR